ncbi:MAG: hypothetical protein ACYSTT_22110 [Planctomycetota bacterium]|jgi:hypothetical protein
MAMHKKTFTVDVDDDLSEAFSAQVDERGYTKYRAIEGAMRAFVALPPEVQVSLMSNKIDDTYGVIVRSLLEKEVLAHLDTLGPTKAKFLAMLKQAKAQEGRKK